MKGPVFNWEGMRMREVVPGYHARVLHADQMTFVLWEVDSGSVLPEHSHEHEQVLQVFEGIFEIVIEGEKHEVHPGEIIRIPSNALHSGTARTWCKMLDAFAPKREDYDFDESYIL